MTIDTTLSYYTGTTKFQTHKVADYSKQEARKKDLGTKGELLVLQYEKEQLGRSNRGDLAEKVRHVAALEGDGAGYDILSYNADGSEKYIEVKTTRGAIGTAFYITSTEVAFSERFRESYAIYRVYEYNIQTNSGKFFAIWGAVQDTLELTPTDFRATFRNAN